VSQIKLSSDGIKRSLKEYKPAQAVAEYIWNGFDAGASLVNLDLEQNQMGGVSSLRIQDNGQGIPIDKLTMKFTPFFVSEKVIDPKVRKKITSVHGEKGVGRLTFFHFAGQARWNTVYRDTTTKHEYEITIDSNDLITYTPSEVREVEKDTGTVVIFTEFSGITYETFLNDVSKYLMLEFGWFLELNQQRNFGIRINGVPLNYEEIVEDRDKSHYVDEKTGDRFDITYVRWNTSINDEYSRYYYIGSDNKERGKQTTTLNNKGDRFFHSVFIKSSFFDDEITFDLLISDDDASQQMPLFGVKKEEGFKRLMEHVNRILHAKRKPFLKQYTDKVVQEFEKDRAFPPVGQNKWDELRHKNLVSLIRELYQVEPRIFAKMNVEQKRIFAYLLDLVMDSNERDKLFDILKEIVGLDNEEREKLANLLRNSSLSNIIDTIKLIEDRYRAVNDLKQLVFDAELHASETKHIQKMIEQHYWLFGEQYHLVAAAERDFEEALRRMRYKLSGDTRKNRIVHPDKNKEMDIFAVRQLVQNEEINNIIIELKNPRIRLGEEQLSQVKRYMRVIRDEPMFNAYHNMTWTFYLVGSEYDSTRFIQEEMKSKKEYGEKFLVHSVDNFKILVMTWSEVFANFELRHKFLYDKLLIARDNLSSRVQNPTDLIDRQANNTAIQPPEIRIPK
jgi:hypothetical protein